MRKNLLWVLLIFTAGLFLFPVVSKPEEAAAQDADSPGSSGGPSADTSVLDSRLLGKSLLETSHDGSHLVTVHPLNRVNLWDLEGDLLTSITVPLDIVISVKFTAPGDALLVTGRKGSSSGRGNTFLYNLQGDLLRAFTTGQIVNSHVSVHPEGELFAVSGEDDRGLELIEVRRIRDGRLVYLTEGALGSFSGCGRFLVHGEERDKGYALKKTVVRNTTDFSVIRSFADEPSGPGFHVIIPDMTGDRVLTVYTDFGSMEYPSPSTLKLWDIEGKLLHLLMRDGGKINQALFSNDGSLLSTIQFSQELLDGAAPSTASGGKVIGWDLNGTSLSTFAGPADVTGGVSASSGGTIYALADKGLVAWDPQTRKEIRRTLVPRLSGNISAIAFNRESSLVAAGYWGSGGGIIFDLQGRTVAELDGDFPIETVTWLDDGNILGADHGGVTLWDGRGTLLKRLTWKEWLEETFDFDPRYPAPDLLHYFDVSPGGVIAVSAASIEGFYESGVWLLDIHGSIIDILMEYHYVTGLTISSDGSRLAVRHDDSMVTVFSLDSFQETGQYSVNDWDPLLDLSPDGKPIYDSQSLGTSGALAAAFSPDGKLLATGGMEGSVVLREAADGAPVQTFDGHLEQVLTLRFSPNGRYLASGSSDGTLYIWNIETGASVVCIGMPGAEAIF